MKRVVIAALLSSVSAAALAQTSPAQMGVTPATTPEVLQVLDRNKVWVPIGSFLPGGPFTPVGGGGGGGGSGNCDTVTNACTHLNVLDYGFKPGGQDNSPYVAGLMNEIATVTSQSSGFDVIFPAIPGQIYTDYYFSKPFNVTKHMNISCQGIVSGGDATTRLVFAAGIHGVIFNFGTTAPDNTAWGGGGMTHCGVISGNFHQGISLTSGSASITNVSVARYTNAWDFQVGDGVIPYNGYQPLNSAPAVAAGAYLSAVNSGANTITLASPYTSNVTAGGSLWRLPVTDAFTIQTTSGSPTVTVTAGPSLLMPGDYVWSDAFPFGTVVQKVSGTVGSQTLTMGPWALNGPTTQNATVTHSAGTMWIIPAAIKAFNQTSLHNNFISSFPWGLEMECSSWGTPSTGCNTSMSQENQFNFSLIGRLAIGDNTGASTSLANTYSYNYITDIAEGGSVGSLYLGDNPNSAEAGTSIYGVIGLCGSQNGSSYIGMYIGQVPGSGYCMNGIGVATSHGGVNMFIGPQSAVPEGSPTLSGAVFYNQWFFNNGDADQTQLCMNHGADVVLAWSRSGQACGGPATWTLEFDNAYNYWGLFYYGGSGGSAFRLTEGTLGSYAGYTAGSLALADFSQGLLLNDTEAPGIPGPERLVDEGLSIPVAAFHKQGDIHFNQAAAVGSPVGWVNVANGANFKPFGVVSSFSGTKTAGSCVFTIVNGVITNVTGC